MVVGPKLPRKTKKMAMFFKSWFFFSAGVLVLHFKRFAMDADGSLCKLSFPVSELSEQLDVSPFGAEAFPRKGALYSLTGVVEHLGTTLRSGHYVAYCKLAPEKWLLISDTSVKQSSLREVLSSQA
jgi:ubiquitin C-terminal hydrolase